jgi:DNA-directed RNA polymerase specialized sigma24 family protein
VSGLADGDGTPNLRARSLTVCRPAFDALDRDWATLVRSPDAAAALRRWNSAPELAAPDLDALLERIWAAEKPEADRACAALAARAPADPTAARALLQVLRPGLRHLGRRLALGGSFDDVDQEILALAWERIRTYRIDRRPAAIAANILLDVRKHYVRQVLTPSVGSVSLDGIPATRWPAARSAEDDALDSEGPSLRRAHARLRSAVEDGILSRLSASVVWRTRVQQDDDADVATELGVNVRTMQRRRQRAERQLAAIA